MTTEKQTPNIYKNTSIIPEEPELRVTNPPERSDDYFYEDDIDPYAPIQDEETIIPDSFYQDWEEERSKNVFAGVHIDDQTKSSLFNMYNQYNRIQGLLKAYRAGMKRMTKEDAINAREKMQRLRDEMTYLLTPSVEYLEERERPYKVQEMIKDFGNQYAGEHNRSKREAEMRRVNKQLGERVLRTIAAD
jgi:hypothetical protein